MRINSCKFLQKGVCEQTIANLFPNYYTQSKGNTLNSCYTLTNMTFI